MNETNPYDNVNDTANEAAQGEAPTITSVMSEAAQTATTMSEAPQNTNAANAAAPGAPSDNAASGVAQGANMPSEPNFTLINPDDPTLNPEAWAETKGGTEGIYTGEKKDEKKSWKSWIPGKRDQDVMDPNFTDPTWPEDFEPEEDARKTRTATPPRRMEPHRERRFRQLLRQRRGTAAVAGTEVTAAI